MKSNRLLYIRGVALSLITLIASACAPPPANRPAAAPAAQPANNEPIVVAVWSGPEHDNVVKVAAEYEKATGAKVTIEELPRESYKDKLNTVLLGGASDYDAIYISGDWIPEYDAAGVLMPFGDFIKDPKVAGADLKLDDKQPGLDYATVNGKVYGYPSEGDTAWMWYREDLLKAKNIPVPTTWEEYLAAAQALNDPPNVYGALVGGKRDEALWDFMHYLYAMGGEVVDPKTFEVKFNSPTSVKALEYWVDLRNKHKLTSPDVTNFGYNEIFAALQQGKAALGVQWMAATKDLTDCKVSPNVCDKLKYTFVPGIKGADGKVSRGQGASSWAWSIPKAAKNPVGAYKFIEWLTGNVGAKMWALNGGIPSNIAVLKDPDVVKQIPQFALLAEIMPDRHLLANTTVSATLADAAHEAAAAAMAGTKSPQDAADAAAAKMTEALKKAGYLK